MATTPTPARDVKPGDVVRTAFGDSIVASNSHDGTGGGRLTFVPLTPTQHLSFTYRRGRKLNVVQVALNIYDGEIFGGGGGTRWTLYEADGAHIDTNTVLMRGPVTGGPFLGFYDDWLEGESARNFLALIPEDAQLEPNGSTNE